MSERPPLRLVAGTAVDDRALADEGCDDIANAQRLIARHGHDLRYTVGLGVLVFDAQRWRLDPEQHLALLRAQHTARAIRDEAAALATEGERAKERADKHSKHAAASANSARLRAMLEQAWPHLAHELADWNARPNHFNVQNGTFAFPDLTLQPHRREDYLTHMAGVAYDENAQYPKFTEFLERVLPAKDVREFVQRALGACLIDSAADQAMIVFHGGGANGKTTLLNAVARVMGSYCMTVAVQTLLYSEQSGSSASPDVARLAERPRCIRVSEPDPGAKLSEGGVKSLTGGEPIVARKLHHEPVEFDVVGKIVLSCNNRPSIRGSDDGIWRRILLVPWNVQIPLDEQLEKGAALEADLEREASGILNWLIAGLSDYLERGGLNPPESVQEETKSYRTDSDPVGRFIADCCVTGPRHTVEGGELYGAFELWAKELGLAGYEIPKPAPSGSASAHASSGARRTAHS